MNFIDMFGGGKSVLNQHGSKSEAKIVNNMKKTKHEIYSFFHQGQLPPRDTRKNKKPHVKFIDNFADGVQAV